VNHVDEESKEGAVPPRDDLKCDFNSGISDSPGVCTWVSPIPIPIPILPSLGYRMPIPSRRELRIPGGDTMAIACALDGRTNGLPDKRTTFIRSHSLTDWRTWGLTDMGGTKRLQRAADLSLEALQRADSQRKMLVSSFGYSCRNKLRIINCTLCRKPCQLHFLQIFFENYSNLNLGLCLPILFGNC